MKLYFETAITYHSEDLKRAVKAIYLVEALSFTESEANITKYLEQEGVNDFEVNSMKKKIYEDLVHRFGHEKPHFFEVKVKIKDDGGKDNPYLFLVSGVATIDADKQVMEFVTDSSGIPTVTKVEQKKIVDLVLVENGQIISFNEYQKETPI